jgi:anti-sigma regulatory factor (Ser/Thr protein kinase)
VKPEEGIVLEFQVEGSNFETGGEASSKIKRVLQQIGVSADVTRRIAVSAYEGEMNIIIHAFHGVIKATIFSDRTELILQDEGPGIADIKLAMQEGYSTAPDSVREMGFGAGMGLPNMARCADSFNIESQVGIGTKIQMMIRH